MSPTPNVDAADAALLREKLEGEQARRAKLQRMEREGVALSPEQREELGDLRLQIPITRACLAAAEGSPDPDGVTALAQWRMARKGSSTSMLSTRPRRSR